MEIIFLLGCFPGLSDKVVQGKRKRPETGPSSKECSWMWKQQVHTLNLEGSVYSRGRKEALWLQQKGACAFSEYTIILSYLLVFGTW